MHIVFPIPHTLEQRQRLVDYGVLKPDERPGRCSGCKRIVSLNRHMAKDATYCPNIDPYTGEEW